MKKQLLLLIVVAVLVILAIMQPNGSNKEKTAKVGFQAPEFELRGFNDASYSLSQIKGKPVLINFWASWCVPCRKEAPEFVRLYNKYKDKVEFYAVNATSDDTIEGAVSFVQQYQLQFPVLLDEKGNVSKLYNVRSYPTTYFVDGKGAIVSINLGIVSPESLEKTIISTIEASKGDVS
ncbi:TlpA family protein disulfide reductase [Paenibacillus sp. MMO-177]|uniref:TlpA family protein disulfide reductase n=1 Tax=Paenibacillus sp. MMO-177 TaxID=3081289 RepID=UPI003016ADAF